MKKVALIILVLLLAGAVWLLLDINSRHDAAVVKALEKEFKDMAAKEDIVGNTLVDSINTRYIELREAFMSGEKKWPSCAGPEDIARYADAGVMHKYYLDRNMIPKYVICVECHSYLWLAEKRWVDSRGAL